MDYTLNFPQHLGLYLKSLRKAKGMSQAGLASLLQVTQSRIAAIEKDPSAVSVGQMMAILELLGAQLVVRAQTLPTEAALSGAAPQADKSMSKNKQSTVVARQAAPAQHLEPRPSAQPLKHTVLADGWQGYKPQGRW
ncbi:XRE family transcriptional regulator [Comamonas aquatica DA1877]|uniref:XRE family transcriptional regulator n=1 Tax=Comamonas aquatica DA1877 TaxID=1457173 RepID=A0A014NHX0_9BURK|nr:helix-turn-helix domain-containing protein [Comamonas aquatica]EXU79028.1 XRE family transcriptional regulator [Comamonas aquatica DA1877]